MNEIFDDYCWQKHKQVITRDRHHIPGLKNFAHWNQTSSVDPSPTHYHSDIWEIHCMIKGKRLSYLEHGDEHKVYTIMGNEAFITFPYEMHGNGDLPQSPCEFYALQINIKERDHILGLNREYSNALCDQLLSLRHRHLRMSSTNFQLIRTAFNLFSSSDPEDILSGVQFLTCFLFNLRYMRAIEEEIVHPVDINIQRAIDYVEQNYSESISLTELADVAGFSLSRFKNKFKEEIGITPAEFITLQKIEQAKKRLESSNVTITELAYELGFSSSNYFCSVFKKLSSCSPKDYRKKTQQDAV